MGSLITQSIKMEDKRKTSLAKNASCTSISRWVTPEKFNRKQFIRNIFYAIDTDGNNYITITDLELFIDVLFELKDFSPTELFDEIRGENKWVYRDDFLEYLGTKRKDTYGFNHKITKEDKHFLGCFSEIFEVLDTDESEFLDPDEIAKFKEFLDVLFKNFVHIDHLWQKLDRDKDEKVYEDEWVAIFKETEPKTAVKKALIGAGILLNIVSLMADANDVIGW